MHEWVSIFKLKCVTCSNVEERLAESCKGDDSPACSKCFGPMYLMEVKHNQRRRKSEVVKEAKETSQ